MQLPILSSLNELFKSVTDDFKTLFQGWSLVAAGLYLFLNLLLVYPLTRENGVVKAFEGLDTVIQVVVATFALVLFGYLVNSLSSFFVSLASGVAFRGSLIDGILRRGQERRYEGLRSRLDPITHDQKDINKAAYRLAYEFPNKAYIKPTRLGNVQAAVADYSVNQYGAHLDTVWPVVEAALVKDEDKLLERIGGEQTSLNFLCALSGLLLITALTAIPARLFLGVQSWGYELVILGALLLVAWVTYRAAVGRAAAWARLVRTALDLHLDKAATALGLRALEGDELIADNKARWQAVSEWLAYGGLKVDTDPPVELPSRLAGWYEDEAARPTHSLTSTAQLKADLHAARQTSGNPVITTAALTLPGPSVEYTITITHLAAEGEPSPLQFRTPVGGFIRVTDRSIPFIDWTVPGQLHRPNGDEEPIEAITRKVEGGPDALLWPIGKLDYRDSAALIYRLDSAVELTLDNAAFVSAAPARSGRAGLLRLVANVPRNGEWTAHTGPVAEARVKGKAVIRFAGGTLPGVQAGYNSTTRQATWKFPGTPAEEVVVLVPLADHGLKSQLNAQVGRLSMLMPSGEVLVFMPPPTGQGNFTTLETTNFILPATGEPPAFGSWDGGHLYQIMKTVDGAVYFPTNPEAAAAERDAKYAGQMLDKYDLLADATAGVLSARDLNNLACFLVWQTAPNPTEAMRLLDKAAELEGGGTDLMDVIRWNKGALAKKGEEEGAGAAAGGGTGVRIGLPTLRELVQNVQAMFDPNQQGGS